MMINAELQYDLAKLSKTLTAYGIVSGKDENDILAKQGGKLAFNISAGLRGLAPSKGSVRAERLAALKVGRGVFVRESVKLDIAEKYNAAFSMSLDATLLAQRGGKKGKGKKIIAYGPKVNRDGKMLNLQALMVERELALRESARGFSGYAAPKPSRSYIEQDAFDSDTIVDIESRYGFLLSTFGLNLSAKNKTVELKWVGAQNESYRDALGGLSKDKQQAVLLEAVRETNDDIQVYIERKVRERAKEMGLS